MSLRDILGVYYNSKTKSILEAPTTVSFFIDFLPKLVETGIVYEVLLRNGEERDKNSQRTGNVSISDTVNQFFPYFYVNKNCWYDSTLTNKNEWFTLTFHVGDKAYTIPPTKEKIRTGDILREYRKVTNNHSKPFSVQVNITRTNSEKLREQLSKNTGGGKPPKEYFAEILATKADTSTQNSSSWGKSAFKYGTVKDYIIRQKNANKRSFLYEYLYGVRVPKKSPVTVLFKSLVARPYTDFGIKDTVELRKLLDSIYPRNVSISHLHRCLVKAGIKPASDMTRWSNLIDLEYKKND